MRTTKIRTGGCVNEVNYLLGHSHFEIQRLINQAAILQATTERLLYSARVERGMRVLDLGCGAGDVAMLAGQRVGASGSVVGIDRSDEALAVAKRRAAASGLEHLSFVQASVESFAAAAPFDVVVGRYVLVHQADPVAFLRAAARFARPGGCLALHEPVVDSPLTSLPRLPLWEQTVELVRATFKAALPNWDAPSRLIEHFSNAGLPQPRLFCDMPVGGGHDAPHYAWLADLVGTLLPQIVQGGAATTETIGIETLEDRLRSAAVEARSQIEGPGQMCAWANL